MDSLRARTLVALPYLVAADAIALIIILSAEVRSLLDAQAQVSRMKAFPHAGQWVPTVRAATLTGDSITLGETAPGRAQILIAFSTTCQFCRATLPVWQRLSDSLRRDPKARFDVVWVSASSWDSTRVYAQA